MPDLLIGSVTALCCLSLSSYDSLTGGAQHSLCPQNLSMSDPAVLEHMVGASSWSLIEVARIHIVFTVPAMSDQPSSIKWRDGRDTRYHMERFNVVPSEWL